jgi:hypothetical protein
MGKEPCSTRADPEFFQRERVLPFKKWGPLSILVFKKGGWFPLPKCIFSPYFGKIVSQKEDEVPMLAVTHCFFFLVINKIFYTTLSTPTTWIIKISFHLISVNVISNRLPDLFKGCTI